MLFRTEPVYKNVSIAILDRIHRLLLKPKAERDIAGTRAKDLQIRPPNPNMMLGSLSGGNQQKVALAKWLTHLPKVLILSEPTRGMDVGAKEDVIRIVKDLRDKGVAILVLSTEPETILTLADRVSVLRKGRVAKEFNSGHNPQGRPSGGGIGAAEMSVTDIQQTGRLKSFLKDQLRNIAPVFTLLALVIFFSVASSSFFSVVNFMNILSQISITAIIAVGLTYVILTAEIDLSVAAIANAVGITIAFFTMQPDYVNIANLPLPGIIAIVLTLLTALCFGLITAFGVTWIGIPSFIMTLAIMQIANGVSALLVRGQIAYSYPDLITMLGSGSIFGIRWTIIVAILFLGIGHLVLTYTRFGRYIYMTGGNREAAEYSGVNVKFIIGSVMVISAVCSGIAGMLAVAYFGSAQQNQFDSYLLDAIAAVVVGGTSLFGGRGGIGNTIIGLLVLGVLNNGLDHIQIDSFLKILIRGLILLSALIINVYAQRLKESE